MKHKYAYIVIEDVELQRENLIELMSNWFDDVQRLDAQTLAKLMRMGARVQKLLELTGQLKSGSKE